MTALAAHHTLDDLINAAFTSLGATRTPEPNTPRQNRWRKSKRFAPAEVPNRIVRPAAVSTVKADYLPVRSSGASEGYKWPSAQPRARVKD